MTNRKPIEILKDTIAQLVALSEDVEVDEAIALKANKQVTVLRTKVEAAALDSLVLRTPDMEALAQELGNIINAANHAGTSEKIAGLQAIVTEVHGILGK